MKYCILRGKSMLPLFEPGIVLALEPVTPQQVQIGNVVVFRAPFGKPGLVAHRVIARTRVGSTFQLMTKGDSAALPDPCLNAEEIHWRVVGRRAKKGHLIRIGRAEQMIGLLLSYVIACGRRLARKGFPVRAALGVVRMKELLKTKQGIVFRREDDEGLLFNPETGEVRLLNETGTLIWEMLESGHVFSQIVDALLGTFEGVDRPSAEADLEAFLADVTGARFLA